MCPPAPFAQLSPPSDWSALPPFCIAFVELNKQGGGVLARIQFSSTQANFKNWLGYRKTGPRTEKKLAWLGSARAEPESPMKKLAWVGKNLLGYRELTMGNWLGYTEITIVKTGFRNSGDYRILREKKNNSKFSILILCALR